MKRIAALALALMCLCACASMLERDYTVSQPHVEDVSPRGDTAYRVETYPALRSALLSYVEEGMEEGVLRFPTTYAGNLSVDMEKAKRQLMEEEPLGCYALDELRWKTSKIIAYYEVELDFTYKMEQKAFTSLPRLTSQSRLTALLAELLAEGERETTVYLTAYDPDDPAYFDDALAQALAQAEQTGPPPRLDVQLYPHTGGARRVARLELVWPEQEGDLPTGTEAAARTGGLDGPEVTDG